MRCSSLRCVCILYFSCLLLLVLSQYAVFAAPQPQDGAARANSPIMVPDAAAVAIADQLPPLPAGPGPGVCEPVIKNADADTGAFGAGCARWLQFALGDYAQLGQTPRISAQARTRLEMGLKDLHMTLAQTARFARITGYTHLAVGTISGSSAHCTLAYQLYAMPQQTAVGPPLQASGSQTQIVAALPRLLGQIIAALKITPAPLPAPPALTPADLRLIGRYAWWPDGLVLPQDQQQMDALAVQQPLAGLLVGWHHPILDDAPLLESTTRRLVAQAPHNLQVRAECVLLWNAYTPTFQQEFGRSMPLAPNNYAFVTWKYVNSSTLQEFVTNAERLVRCAPRYPAAWIALARQYNTVSEKIRRGRPVNMITASEWQLLNKVYARWLTVAVRATDIDANYGLAWTEVSLAATYASQANLADTALWKAMRLDSKNPQVYTWGLQIYQPKWFGDPAKLDKVAQYAVAAQGLPPDSAYTISQALQKGKRTAEAKILLDRAMQGYRDIVRLQPENAQAHRILGARLIEQQRYEEALPECKEAARLAPQFADSHYSLGYLYQVTKHPNEAIAELRESVRIAPQSYNSLAHIGAILLDLNKTDEAQAAYQQSLQIVPDFYAARIGLGMVLFKKEQYAAALIEFEYAGRLAPEAGEPYFRRGGAYDGLKQYDKAIEVINQGLPFAPNSYMAHYYLGLAYTGQEKYDEAIPEYRAALRQYPKMASSHLELGRALLKRSQKEEAQTELKTAISLDPGGVYAKDAQQLLDTVH